MPKYKSIPHQVTAVQWNGEVTPDVREVFGGRELVVTEWGPEIVGEVPAGSGPSIGDWIVRFDYEDGAYDIEVMESEDFQEMYEPIAAEAAVLEINMNIPARVTSQNGQADTDIRVTLHKLPVAQDILLQVTSQIFPHIRDPEAIRVVVLQALKEMDENTLSRVRDVVDQMIARASAVH